MIVVDVETTGTEAHKHSLLSIGAVDFDDPARRFYGECRMRDGAHIMDGALEINGFTEEEIRDPKKMAPSELAAKFVVWALEARDHTVGGQNPYLDYDFIRESAEIGHEDFPIAKRTLDLHTVCWMHIVMNGGEPPIANKRSNINSAFICHYVGIPEEGKPHIGLNGALWEAEAFSRLLYGKNFLPEFAGFPLPEWKG
ncbi:MAG TPA: exonuclease domain-containing protein [Candidatus Paceibacterota bacterium]|jgi:DNA polymerase III epsilon subunit-like protein|nr:exonuclease domain-containing protein [Candidatus Paceibacterota bacterium]